MKTTRRRRRLSVWLLAMIVMAVAIAGMSPAMPPALGKTSAVNTNPPPFDFSDTFYRANGIVPEKIRERVGNPDRNPLHWTFDNSNIDPNRRNVRVLETTGGWNNSGNLIYYSIMGTLMPDSFERDASGNLTAAGRQAMDIANNFRAFIFPKTNHAAGGTFVKSPAPTNRRQDNIFDTRNGTFSNNLLGNWLLVFVVYTPKAFTPEGQARLAPFAAKNGTDLDGTPILHTANDIDSLAADGFVKLVNRNTDGSEGFPWVV
ncbi:MAG: hypothetical protein LC754_13975 [Acidobacteria bacterium]|nr:hypothetical protein [Acidobacteriota bacterium]